MTLSARNSTISDIPPCHPAPQPAHPSWTQCGLPGRGLHYVRRPASTPRRVRLTSAPQPPPTRSTYPHVEPPLPHRGGTHLPSTASTSRHSISCSCSARSIRSRRSCRRFRLIMKTCGPELWLDPPGRPPAPPLREGPAYLVKAHLVWRLGRHREEPRGLRGWVLHWAAERSRGVTGVIGKSGGVQPPSNAPSPPSAGLPVIPSSSAWCWKPCPTQPRSQHQC